MANKMNKTYEVELLVEEVLPTLPMPYTEDVTLDVCRAIAENPKWLAEYNSLVGRLKVDPVNNAIGRHVGKTLGWQRNRQVKAAGPLVKSYSKLKP